MDQRTQWTDRITRTALLLAAGLGALWLARRLAGKEAGDRVRQAIVYPY